MFFLMLCLMQLDHLPWTEDDSCGSGEIIESEVKKMTMDEVKEKLLDKIDGMLAEADADDVRKLSEAYSLLRKDELLEQIAHGNGSFFNGVAGPAARTEANDA